MAYFNAQVRLKPFGVQSADGGGSNCWDSATAYGVCKRHAAHIYGLCAWPSWQAKCPMPLALESPATAISHRSTWLFRCQVYVSGSWDKFSSYEAMEGGRDGRYRAIVAVGADACAEFQPPSSKSIARKASFPRFSRVFEGFLVILAWFEMAFRWCSSLFPCL